MSSNFDPKVIFHNSDKNTTVSVTVVDSVLNALTVNEEVSLTFNYEGKDVDQDGYVTFENRNTVLKVIGDLLDADLMFDRPSILKPLYNYDRFYGELISSPFVGKISGIRHIRTVWTISRSKDFDDTRLQTKNEVITVDRGDLTRAQVIFNSEEEIYIKVKYVAEYTDGTGRHEVELTSFPKLCNSKITKPIRAANIAILDENENEVYQAKYYEKRKIAGAVEGLCYKIGLRLNNWYETTLEGNDVPLGGTPENATRVIVKVYNRNPDDPVLPARYGEKFTTIEADVKFKEACDLGKSLCLAGKDYFILGKADSDGNNLATVNSSTTDTYDQYFALDSEKGEIEYVEENRTLKIKPFKLWQSPYFSINSFCYLVVRIYRGDAGVEQHYKTIKLDLISSMLEKENLIHTPVDNFKHVLNVNKPYELSKHMNTITLNLDDSILNDIHESTTWEIVAMKKTYKPEDYKSFDNSSYPARPAIPRLFSLYRFKSSVFKKTLGYSVDDVMVLEDLKNKVPSNYNYMDRGWWAPREYKTALPSPSVDSIADSLGAGNFYCTGDSFCRVFGINNNGIDFYNSLVNTDTSNITANPGDLIMSFRLEDGSIQVTHAQTGRLFIRSLDSTHCCHVVIIKDRDTNEILHSSVHYEKDSSNPSNTYNGDGLAGYVPITRNGSTTNLTYYHVDSRRNIEITCNKFENLSTPFNLTSSFNTPKKRYEEFKRMNNLGSVPVDELVKGYVGLPIDSPYLQAAALGKLDLDATYSKGEFNLYIKVTLNIRNAVSGMESSPVFIPLEIGKMNKYRGFNRNDHFVNTVWKHDFLASLAVNPDTDVMYNNKFLHKTFNPTTSVLNPLGHPMSTIHDFRTMKDTSISQCMAITPSLFLVKRKQEFKTIVFDSIEQLAYYFESLTKYSEPTKEAYDKKASGEYSDFDVAISRIDRRRMITIKTSKNLFDKLNYDEVSEAIVENRDFYVYGNEGGDAASRPMNDYISTEHNSLCYFDSNMIFTEAYLQTYENILSWLKTNVSNGTGDLDQQPFFIDVYDVQGAPTRPKFREAIVVTISKEMVDKGIYFQGHDGILNKPIPLLTVDRARSFPRTEADSVALGPVSLSYALNAIEIVKQKPQKPYNNHEGRNPYFMMITENNAKLGSYTANWEEGYQGCVADISPSGLMLNNNESYFKLSSQVDLFSSNFEYYGLIQFKDCTENSLLGFKGDFLPTKDGYKKGQEFVDPDTGALYYCYDDFKMLENGYYGDERVDKRIAQGSRYRLNKDSGIVNGPYVKISDHSLNAYADDAEHFYVIPEKEYRKYYKSSLPTYVSLLSYLNLILPAHEGLIFDPTLGDKNKDWIDINGSDEGDGTMNKYRVFALPNEYSGDVVYEQERIGDNEEVITSTKHPTLMINAGDDDGMNSSYFDGTSLGKTFSVMITEFVSSVNSSFNYDNCGFIMDIMDITKLFKGCSFQDALLNFGWTGNSFYRSSSATNIQLTFTKSGDSFQAFANGSSLGSFWGSSREYSQILYIYNKTDNILIGWLVCNHPSSPIDSSSVSRIASSYVSTHSISSTHTLFQKTFDSPKDIYFFKMDTNDAAVKYKNITHKGNLTYAETILNNVAVVAGDNYSTNDDFVDEENKKIVKKICGMNIGVISKYSTCRMVKDSSYAKFNLCNNSPFPNPSTAGTGQATTLKSLLTKIIPTFDENDGCNWIMQTNEFMEKTLYDGGLQDFYQNFNYYSTFSSHAVKDLIGRKVKITLKPYGTPNQTNSYHAIYITIDGTERRYYNEYNGWIGIFSIVIDGALYNSYLWHMNKGTLPLDKSIVDSCVTLQDANANNEVILLNTDFGTNVNLSFTLVGAYTNKNFYSEFTSEEIPPEPRYYVVDKPSRTRTRLSPEARGNTINTPGSIVAPPTVTGNENYIYPLKSIDILYSEFELYSTRGFSNQHSGGKTLFKTYQQALQSFLGSDYGKSFVMRTQQFIDAIGYTGGLQNFYQNYDATDSNMDSYKDFTNCTNVEIKINNDVYEVWNNGSKVGYIGETTSWNESWDALITVLKDGEMYDTFIISILNNSSHSGVSSTITSRYDSFVNLTNNQTLATVYTYTFSSPCTLRFYIGNILPSTNIYTDFSSNLFYSSRDSAFRIPNPKSYDGTNTETEVKFEFKPAKNYAVKSTFPYKYLEEYFKAYDKYQDASYLSYRKDTIRFEEEFKNGVRNIIDNLGGDTTHVDKIKRYSCSLEDYLKITGIENKDALIAAFNDTGEVKTINGYKNLQDSNVVKGTKIELIRASSDDANTFSIKTKNPSGSYLSYGSYNVILDRYTEVSESYMALIRIRLLDNARTAVDKYFIYYNDSFGTPLDNNVNSVIEKLKEVCPSFVGDVDNSTEKLIGEIDFNKEFKDTDFNKTYLILTDIKFIVGRDNLRDAKILTSKATTEMLDTTIFGGWYKFKNKNYNNFIYMSTRPVLWVKDLKTIASANIAHPRQSIIRIGLKHYYVRLVTDRFYPDDDCCLDPVTLAGQQTSQPDFDTFNDPWCLNFRESLITPNIMSLCMIANKNIIKGGNETITTPTDYCLKDISTLYYINGDAILNPTHNYMIYSSNLSKRNAFFNEHGTVMYSATPYKSPYHCKPGNDGKYLYSYIDDANLNIAKSDVTYNLHISQPAFEYGSDEELFGKNELVFGQPVRMSGFYLKSDSKDDRLIFTYVKSENNKINDEERRTSNGPRVYDPNRGTELAFPGLSLRYDIKDKIPDNEMNHFQDYHPVHIVLEAIEEKDLPIYNIKDSLKELLNVNGSRTTGKLSSLAINDSVARTGRFINNIDYSNFSANKENIKQVTTYKEDFAIGVKKIKYNDGHVVPYISSYKPSSELPGLSTYYNLNVSSDGSTGDHVVYGSTAMFGRTYDTLTNEISEYGQWMSQYRRTWGTLDVDRLIKGEWGGYKFKEYSDAKLKLYDRWSGVGYLGTISSTKSLDKQTNGVNWKQNYGVYNTLTSQLEKILRHRLISSNTIREDDKTYIPVCHVFYYKGKIVLIPRETSFNIYEPDMYGFNYTKDMEHLEYGRSKPIDRTTRDIGRVKVGLNVLDPFLPYLSNDRSMHSLQELVRDIIPIYVKK